MKNMDNFEKNLCKKLFINKENYSEINEEGDLLNYRKNCYFENLTDDCFFDYSGPKDDFVMFYKKIIKSGVGNIILGGVNLGLKSLKTKNHAILYNEDRILKKYKEIAFFAHSANVKIYLKIKAVVGRYINLNDSKLKLGSNFCLDPENKQKIVMRISDNKCNELISEISEIVLLSKICKFDGIVIDATYRSIIGELSSNEFNKRIFGYFSNVDDFLTKTLKSIETKSTFIILKLSINSLFVDTVNFNKSKLNQLSPKSFFDKIRSYINLGVDAFEFEFGGFENSFLHCFNGFEDEFLYVDFIKTLREYLTNQNIKTKRGEDAAIFYHENIFSYKKAIDLINKNTVQFIDVTRSLFADNLFFYKLKNAKYIQKCLNCSHCNKTARNKRYIECLINPKLIDFDTPIFNKESKVIAVVGGGVSGIICALTLIERGYEVFLFEQNSMLNKNGFASAIYGFDKSLKIYYDYLNQKVFDLVNKNKLNLFLNTEFNASKDNLKKFHTIVLATGFKTKLLAVSGAVQSHVKSIYEILENKNYLNKRNNISIYANSELGLKLALYLSLNKKSVSVVIKDIDLLNKQKNSNTYYYFYMLYECGVKIYFHSKIININEDNIDILINKNLVNNSFKTMIDVFSNSKIKYDQKLINIDCDLLIYEPICVPNNSLYAEIVNKNYMGEIYLIGNALENSDLAGLIKSGYFVAKNI